MHFTTRFIIGLLLFSVVACTNKKNSSHNSNNDSINKYLNLVGSDTLVFPKKDKYNNKALSFVDLNKNDTLTRFYLRKISSNFYDTNNWKNYRKVALHLLKNATEASDTLDLAMSYRLLGNYYFENQVLDSSFYYYIKAEKNYLAINDKENYGVILLKKGIVQYNVNDYLGAQLTLNKALNYFKTTNDKERLIALYISLGIVETEMKDFEKAIEYFNLSLSEQNKSNSRANEINKAFNYFNLGDVYFKLGDLKKALRYVELALNCENIKEKDSKLYYQALSSYAFYKMKLKDYNQLPNLFYLVIQSSDSLNYFKSSFFTRLDISEFCAIQKDTLMAQKYADEALKIARKSKVPYNILNALRQVGVVNKNKAAQAINEYDKKTDSLLAEERKARNQFYKIQLETDEITQQKEFAVKQNGKTMLIMTGILCIVILLFVIYRQNAKQKELKLLQSQQNANEELYQLLLNQQNKEEEIRVTEKKRIAQELHDGVMNRLAGTRINLFILTRNRDEETINKCIGYIQDIHAIENEIRNIAHDLNNDFFNDSNSFVNLVNNFIKELNNSHTTHFELEVQPDINWDTIHNHIKMHCYRILQEAALNCVKHAQASQVTVSMLQDATNICMSISDNGKGFNANSVKHGMGLKNIHKRIQSLHGSCSIQSSANGTSINLALPLK